MSTSNFILERALCLSRWQKPLLTTLAMLMLISTASSPARSETTPKRYALVIGNADYRDNHRLPALANPLNDAASMERALAEVGFQVTLLKNASRRDMIRAVLKFGIDISRDKSTVGLFYYAGHGTQENGLNYLLPVDAKLEYASDLQTDGYDLRHLLEVLKQAHNQMNIIILDACRNNSLLKKRGWQGGIGKIDAPSGTFIGYATAPGQAAVDGIDGEHGVFTEEFLKAMKEPGLLLEQMFKRVIASTKAQTDGQQEPWSEASVQGDFYFVPPLPGHTAIASLGDASSRQDPELTFWQSVSGSHSVDEYQAYLDQYPNGRFAALARSRRNAAASRTVATVNASTFCSNSRIASSDRGAPISNCFKDCPDACPEMIIVPAGAFTMGADSAEEEKDAQPETIRHRSEPQHNVTIGKPFAIGRFHVKKSEYAAFARESQSIESGCFSHNGMNVNFIPDNNWNNPGFLQTGDDPVVCVSWDDAVAYTYFLSEKTGHRYRLVSEAEWEYAARAGSTTSRWWGDSTDDQCRYANGADISYTQKFPNDLEGGTKACDDGYVYTSPSGKFLPNAFGLYDVLGNVWDWTQDCRNVGYLSAPTDGRAWLNGNCGLRAVRGGSWTMSPNILRSAYRTWSPQKVRSDGVGFRVAMTLD
jgi:formylglycine-generating enzyme required for sulfatase activity